MFCAIRSILCFSKILLISASVISTFATFIRYGTDVEITVSVSEILISVINSVYFLGDFCGVDDMI